MFYQLGKCEVTVSTTDTPQVMNILLDHKGGDTTVRIEVDSLGLPTISVFHNSDEALAIINPCPNT